MRVRNFEWLNRNSPEESIYYNRNNVKTSLPEGFELQKSPRLQVKKIENKEDYIDMFLTADPSKDLKKNKGLPIKNINLKVSCNYGYLRQI